MFLKPSIIAALLLATVAATRCSADNQWVVYEGDSGPGHGKHIVFISGDEEYRSEEALPALGKILAEHHGYKCTVLFAINPETGDIDPNYSSNIPGLEALKSADLMVIFTRFRALPDEQMQHIDDYLRSGGPVLGMRTATHAFNFKSDSNWMHYSNGYRGEKTEWHDGFGRVVLGEKWISHHGRHKSQSTRGFFTGVDHPILNGIKDGEIWGPSDVYGVRLPLPGDSKALVLGQVVNRTIDDVAQDDVLYGMRPTDTDPAGVTKNRKGEERNLNSPMMPIAWTKTYQIPGGKQGNVFNSTLGASTDILHDATRRMFVNAALHLTDVEVPSDGANVEFIGEFSPTRFEFRRGDYWPNRKMKVSEHELSAAAAR